MGASQNHDARHRHRPNGAADWARMPGAASRRTRGTGEAVHPSELSVSTPTRSHAGFSRGARHHPGRRRRSDPGAPGAVHRNEAHSTRCSTRTTATPTTSSASTRRGDSTWCWARRGDSRSAPMRRRQRTCAARYASSIRHTTGGGIPSVSVVGVADARSVADVEIVARTADARPPSHSRISHRRLWYLTDCGGI